jgi:hypothetical protein
LALVAMRTPSTALEAIARQSACQPQGTKAY